MKITLNSMYLYTTLNDIKFDIIEVISFLDYYTTMVIPLVIPLLIKLNY